MAGLSDLYSSLGLDLAAFDAEANRARTTHADKLRQIASLGMQRKKSLSDSLASSGMAHSSAALGAQSELSSTMDQYRNEVNQELADRLANIARQKIQAESGFKINSLMPR